MEDFKITELLNGRPEKVNDKQMDCYDTLDELGIKYQRVDYNYFPHDIEGHNKIDSALEVKGIKNLVYRTKNKSQYFLIILPMEKRFDDKEFREKFNLPKISMANQEELNELLKTTPGSVNIMGLKYDKENKVQVFIDKCIFEYKYFRFHPNENITTLRISMEDFNTKLIPYLNHEVKRF